MNESARVRFVGALGELRGGLTQFSEKTLVALDAVAAELRRTQEWLEDQARFWQTEIRKCEETIFLAKQALSRKRMMQLGDRPPDCWEEEQALRHAKRRLELAEEKQEITRHWLRQWTSEIIEYEGPARLLKSFVEGDLSRAAVLLQNKMEMLEAYLGTASPGGAASVSLPTEPPSPSTRPKEKPA